MLAGYPSRRRPRGDSTLARTQGGLGLGLALVKGIAELHGGAVYASSAGKGEGAELVESLPLIEQPAADAAPITVRESRRAIEAGFDQHVAKPCDPEQIARLLG